MMNGIEDIMREQLLKFKKTHEIENKKAKNPRYKDFKMLEEELRDRIHYNEFDLLEDLMMEHENLIQEVAFELGFKRALVIFREMMMMK